MTATDRHTATTETGHTVDLTEAHAGASGGYETTIVRYFHAQVPVYTPAPEGASYTFTATCTHMHPDADGLVDELDTCRERLRRIIQQDKRLPKWAKLV